MSIPFHDRISCTVPEACAATGIGRSKLYEEMAAGRLQTTCVGRRRLILVGSLVRLLAGRQSVSPMGETNEIFPAPKPDASGKVRGRRASKAP
jgi:excisionase family DNA binding protein